ncbi:iron complex transport system substrate-binding protein [Paenibacillus turicensis]|uniref:Iron complex transport system substrate-binding protein n=1 Tax=Paenibacillus turicensis TaxID=160487 RepID=A0ABS4FVE2_9BACL|nr:AraC family transcriptional regulator [Paenibacillus turicensis]MBP1906489.1 iron complex transport system substrate-binding protein [Paenibacillus turicensis]
MNWEAYIQQWSSATVRLIDMKQYRIEDGTLPAYFVASTSFFIVTVDEEATHIVHGIQGEKIQIKLPTGASCTSYVILYKAIHSENSELEERDYLQVSYTFNPTIPLTVLEKCKTIHRLWQQHDPLDKLEAQAMFLSFVHEMLRQIRVRFLQNNRLDIVTEAIHYMQDHYQEPITADRLARIYNCSTSYLARLFKNQLGVGPIEYLIHMRIHKAKQLLLKTEARLGEIASNVGYSDVYYFSRLFKKHTGYSPIQFRELHGQMVQYNPLELLKSSIVSKRPSSHNENETYYQWDKEGDTSMFRFSRPTLGAVMLLCTFLILSACQSSNSGNANSSAQAPANVNTDSNTTADASSDKQNAETREYKHLKGTTTIPVAPQRVVSLFHLGELMTLGVKPVGTTTFILDNPSLGDVSDITDVGVPPDLEKILSLEPDLIVTTAPFAEAVEGGYEALSQIAPTIVVEQYNDPIKDVAMFGDILGKQEEAARWNKEFTAKIEKYKTQINPLIGANETFTILNVRPGNIFIYGDTNMGGNIIYKYLGLNPTEKIQSDVINGETWEISAEAIPQFVGDHLLLAVNEGAEENMKKVEKLIRSTPAGKSGNIYNIDFDQFLPSDPISVEKQLDIIYNLLVEKK